MKKNLLIKIVLILYGSFYLHTSHGAQTTEVDADLVMMEISTRISLLEEEVKLIKLQQKKSENLAHDMMKMEQRLVSLQALIKQNVGSGAKILQNTATGTEGPETTFFVPAGW